MAPRAFGALFALAAAMLLLASLGAGVAPKVIPGWWDGHPRVDGKTIERKEIHVGLLGGHGCNIGETVKCEPLPTGATLAPIGMAELAAIGGTLGTLIALMMSAWAIGDRRKWLAKIVLAETVVIALIGAVLVLLGPQIKSTQHVDVPIGIGMMMFWAGVGSASIAGLIVRRLEREPLRLRASAPAVARREPEPEPEPDPVPAFDFNELVREDQQRAPVPSPGGHLAGPAGPLMPMGVPPPPLSPLQMLPPSAPPPMPPPLFELPPRVPTEVEMGLVPPAISPRSSSPSVPPPVAARTKSVSVPPPPSKFPTLEHAIPPPPNAANQPAPTVLPAHDGAVDVQRDPADPITAVELDADAKARGAARIALPGMPPIAPLPALTEPRASTEVDASPGDSMAPAAARDSAETLARPRVSASEIATPARDSAETLARPRVTIDPPAPAPRAKGPTVNPPLPALDPARPRVPAPAPRDSAATIARPRVSAPVIETAPPTTDAPTAEPEAEPPLRASQVPISTAPASLPPPRKTTQTVAGPTPGCPQCEAPMAWVDEHLRFYCPQCRMYF